MNYPKIKNIFLVLTHRCNLACRYCFVSQENLDMPLTVAFDAIDFIANNLTTEKDSGSVCFFGGEPLLKWDDIIVPTVLYKEKMYPNKKIRFSITSNCVLLTQDKIDFLKAHNIGLLTSIDGAKETQDYNRPFHNGKGSFDIVEQNLKLYRDTIGLDKATFRSTVYPPTCDKLYENYLYAIEFGYKHMFFCPDSFSTWEPEQESIVREQVEKIADHYIDYWRTNKKQPISINPFYKYMNHVKQDLIRQENNEPSIQRIPKGKCGYGQGSGAAISPTGDIYGCQEMTSNEGENSIFYIGNIYDEEISDERRIRLKEIYESTSVQGDIQCENCKAKVLCDGGCVANNYMSTGDLNHATHGYCFFMRLVYDIDKKIYEALKDIPEFINTFNPKNKKQCSSSSTSCAKCMFCQAEQNK